MFLPGETFFSAALEQDPALIEERRRTRGVILASPTTLIALLRAVAYGWRQETIAENARQISELGRELYKRIVTLSGALRPRGQGLSGAVEAIQSRVLVQARRFKELAAAPEKELPGSWSSWRSPRARCRREKNRENRGEENILWGACAPPTPRRPSRRAGNEPCSFPALLLGLRGAWGERMLPPQNILFSPLPYSSPFCTWRGAISSCSSSGSSFSGAAASSLKRRACTSTRDSSELTVLL